MAAPAKTPTMETLKWRIRARQDALSAYEHAEERTWKAHEAERTAKYLLDDANKALAGVYTALELAVTGKEL